MVSFYGTIDYPDEHDFYAYTLKADTQYLVSVQGENLGYTLSDTSFTIYDSALNFFTSEYYINESPSGTLEVDDPGTYYLVVGNITGSTGTYLAEIAYFGSELDPFTTYEPDVILHE